MAVDPLEFRSAMSRLPTGVTILTTAGGAAAEVMTANAVMSVSLDPVLLAASVGSGSQWLSAVRAHGAFAVNVLGAEHRDLARWCADPRRRECADALAGQPVVAASTTGLPLLADALATFECALRAEHPAVDHVLLVAEVVSVRRRETGGALVFFDRHFAGLQTPRLQSVDDVHYTAGQSAYAG